jgi:protein TonB
MTIQRQEYEVESRRRLQKGILWSLGIHLLVLGGGFTLPRWSNESAMALVPANLQARLVASRSEIPAPALPNAGQAAAFPKAPASKLHEAAPQIIAMSASSAPVSVSEPVAASSNAVIPAPTLVPAPASALASQEPASVASATAVVPSPGTLDADALRSYRIALAAQAKRFKRYPPQATAAGWVGTVDVRVSVLSGGRAAPAELVRSSGYEALDRAALTMLDAAAQRVMVPAALRGQTFVVTLPVVYSLDDQSRE